MTGPKTVRAGSSFDLVVPARKPDRVFDPLYQDQADLFVNRHKIASALAVNGVVTFNVILRKPGRTVLVVRDHQDGGILGDKIVTVVS